MWKKDSRYKDNQKMNSSVIFFDIFTISTSETIMAISIFGWKILKISILRFRFLLKPPQKCIFIIFHLERCFPNVFFTGYFSKRHLNLWEEEVPYAPPLWKRKTYFFEKKYGAHHLTFGPLKIFRGGPLRTLIMAKRVLQ